MVYGIEGVPANELLNGTRLQTRYKEVYGLIEFQRAGSQFRTKSSMLNHTLPQLTGSVRDPHRRRLVQSAISTRLLEIVLGLMRWAAAVAGIWAIDTRRTSPQNPCSIGAVISLLAGTSQILNESVILTGSEQLSYQELLKQGGFGWLLFSLGWWAEDRERRFGIGIGQARRE